MNWIVLLPYILQLVAFIFGRSDASQKTVQAFQQMIDATQSDGLISDQAHAKFQEIHQELMAKFGDQNGPVKPA